MNAVVQNRNNEAFHGDLGKLYQSIPFQELSFKIPLRLYEHSGRGDKEIKPVKFGAKVHKVQIGGIVLLNI